MVPPRMRWLVPLMLLSACTRTAPDRVILIVVDTLRGDYATTPTLTRLATEGTAVPAEGSFHQTSASMGALFTGRTPSLETPDRTAPLPWNGHTWCGMARFGTGEAGSECLPQGLPTLGERMQAAGYRTIGVASNDLLFRPAGFHRGFDTWIEVGASNPPQQAGEPLVDFARRSNAARAGEHVRAAALDAIGDTKE